MAVTQGPQLAPRTERRRWTPAAGAYGGRKSRLSFDYEAFIPPAIGDAEIRLPADVAGVVTEAEVAVRKLNERSPQLGALEALARQLLRTEAVASSRIEGLEMSHRRLARAAFASEQDDASARSVVGNVRAMEAAIALGASRRTLRAQDVNALHSVLFKETRDASIAGKTRTRQNWIGGDEDAPRGAEFIPPPHELVNPLLEDLAEFMRRDDLPAIAHAAVVHSQFETVHPFADGNGRVGRCLIHVILRRRGLAPTFVPPVSLILATDQREYVRGLTMFRAYEEAEIASWIGLFAQAMRTAAREAEAFAGEIAELQRHWRELAKVRRTGSTVDKIISRLPAQPVLNVRAAAAAAGVVYEAARLAMEQLERAGVVRVINQRRRDRLYEAPALFELIDTFEHRLATPRGSRKPARRAPRPRRR